MIDLDHIHPMLVHFPLVLLPIAVLLDWFILVKGGDLASRKGLSLVSASAWGLAAVISILVVIFGDIAFDAALGKGFPKPPLEEHEEFGMTTFWIIVGLALVRLLAMWRGISLKGLRGYGFALGGVVMVALLITTAFYGGELVYSLGVNVDAVKP
jgi:uncharacterized membrane protein